MRGLTAPRSRQQKPVVDHVVIVGNSGAIWTPADHRTLTERTVDVLLDRRTTFQERRDAMLQWLQHKELTCS